jgi:LysM repeat protein
LGQQARRRDKSNGFVSGGEVMSKRWSALLGVLFLASAGYADTPKLPQFLRLQGHFTDSKIPLTDNLPVRFSIWDTPDGYGNLLWVDIQNVSVQSDTFQVMLGRLKPLTPSVFSGGDRWVELQIGSDAPLRPRYKIPNQYIQAEVAAAVQAAPVPVAPPPPNGGLSPVGDAVVTPPPVVTPSPAAAPVLTVKKKRVALVSDGSLGPVYHVQSGDTLKSIAQKLYGNSELWYDLYYLNRDRLGPMGHLFTGQILVLPSQMPAGTPHP